LCEVAERLREATRSTDTVPRIAGDEFVVLCPGLDTERDLDAVIERVDRVVSMPGLRDDGPLPPVMSSALCSSTAAGVLRRADRDV